MKKFFVLVVAALSLGFVSCSDEDDTVKVKSGLSIVCNSEKSSIAQFDTLYLKASTDLREIGSYEWKVDGKLVSTASEYKFSESKTGVYAITLMVTAKDEKMLITQKKVNVSGKFSNGSFILNEGNMTNETGTLTFIDGKGMMIDSAYYRVNGTLLGNACQDMFIADGKMYVISQNGAKNGGEGLLTIAKADNLEKIEVYNNGALSWPTHIAVAGDNIYIRDSKGISLLKNGTKELTLIENSRAAKNHMVVIGTKVFAMNGTRLLVLQNGSVLTTVEMPGSLSGIAKSYDGQLWASCTSGTGKFLKISASDYSIMETHDLGTIKIAGGGSAPAFSAVSDTLYFRNAGFELYRHAFKANKTEFVADVKESIPDAGVYYNSLGVNPVSGEVYFATLKGYGMDYKINDIAIFNFSKKPALQHDFKNKNSFPAGVYFTANF